MSRSTPSPRVEIFPTVEELEIAAAGELVTLITEAVRERGTCLIALSGGNTPGNVYRRLGELLLKSGVDLNLIHIIFVDERMVPPADAESNFGMVERMLFSRLPIPTEHIHRIRGELAVDAAVSDYRQQLASVLPGFGGRCDLILLGVGEDGHTASMFPGTEVLRERQQTASAQYVPLLQSWRVTLTLPLINRARAVLFLVSGIRKADIVGRILGSARGSAEIPASLVRPEDGTLSWLLDQAAATSVVTQR